MGSILGSICFCMDNKGDTIWTFDHFLCGKKSLGYEEWIAISIRDLKHVYNKIVLFLKCQGCIICHGITNKSIKVLFLLPNPLWCLFNF